MPITFEEFERNMHESGSRLLQNLRKELIKSALRMEGRSKQKAFSQFNNSRVRGGRLRQSIAGTFGYHKGSPTAFLQAGGQMGGGDVFYARFIEFGTKDPPKPRLVYFGKEDGKKIFRWVKRGIRPRLFIGRSIAAEQKIFPPDLREAVTAALVGGRIA